MCRYVSKIIPLQFHVLTKFTFPSQLGEFVTDYVEVRRDYRDWTPAYNDAVPVRATKDGISESTSSTADSPPPAAAGDRHGVPDLTNKALQPPPNGLDSISEKPVEETS